MTAFEFAANPRHFGETTAAMTDPVAPIPKMTGDWTVTFAQCGLFG
jgi:hypothetical protein